MSISATGSGSETRQAPARDTSPQRSATTTQSNTTPSSASETSANPGTSGANATSPAATVRDQVEVNRPEEIPNPYSFSPYAERVTAEQWSKDRTPGEGQVSRDDHLIGMLQNRGFSNEEIYARDESGKTMFERVAAANNVDNPNLIQAGQSYIIPSRNEPAEVSAEASAHAQGLEGAYASAEANQELGDLTNQRAEASSRAEASAQHGDATAEAATTQNVGNMDNAVATASAEAEASSVTGDATATATSDQTAGNIQDSRLTNTAGAQADTVTGDAVAAAQADQTVGTVTDSTVANRAESAAESGTGDAAAVAAANQEAGAVVDSRVSNTAEAEAASVTGDAEAASRADQVVASASGSDISNTAEARAETVTGEAATTAGATTEVGPIQDSTITNAAHIERVQGQQGQAITAATGIQAEDAAAATASDTVVAGPTGTATDQAATLAGATGPATVAQVASGLNGEGSSGQVLDVEGPQVAVSQESDAGRVEQDATNWGETPPGTPTGGASQANLTATDSEFASQSSTGFQTSELTASGVDMAAQRSDAQQASYNLEGGRLVAYHEGKDGTVDISANAQEGVFFNDGAANDFSLLPSGNTITGDVRSPNQIIDAQSSESVRGTFGSNGGDTRVELRLPEGNPGEAPAGDAISVPLANGNDYLVTTGGNPQMLVEKPSGQLNLHQTDLRGDDVRLAYDLGQSNLGGYVDLRGTEGADVAIRSDGGQHDVRFQGGPGSTLTLQLTGDQAPPRVVTQEAGILPTWLGGQAEAGYLPEGSQGTIYAPGFERVVVMRGDEIVYPNPPGDQPQGFDQVAQSIRAASQGN